ncbi:hypothetical protein BDV27DRAFT_125228 [Aspergillus caelatus]|uniref:BTB domain-containing protein n=1 Tax=Aspergillus caelatus TaxID=61420 RepID=A0A5N7A9X1_9EURO|nr:uncharacterized protein BDV27DRAFT_125228 [Aspergillus caelatus]KAE8366515.1 hypothetical protein BDV27DRAFT_125228 [Aspergillus caelatus]
MDNGPQNGDKLWSTPTDNSFDTSPGFGFSSRDRSNLSTEEHWTRCTPSVQEPEPEPKAEPETVAAPDPEPTFAAKLPDDPLYDNWNNICAKDRKKRTKSLTKKGLPIPGKDFQWPPRLQALVVESPEPLPQLEPESEPAAEPEPEPLAAAKMPDDPLYNNWDDLSAKNRKKREKSLTKKGLPVPGKDFPWSPTPTPEPVIEELEPQLEHPAQPEPEPKPESPRPASFPPQSDRALCAQSVATGSSSLLFLLSKIRDTGAFSDLKIKCGLSTFNTHCCIVCSQSSFFETAIQDGSKEMRIIDHPFVVKAMLDYLYRGDYDDYELAAEVKGSGGQGPTLPTYVNAIMHVTADVYAIKGLKDLAKKRLVSNLIHEWNDADFIELIEYVYRPNNPANSTLQSILAQFAAQHVSTLRGFQSFHSVLKKLPQFMYIFSGEMMERLARLEKEAL